MPCPEARTLLRSCFCAAVAAADPMRALPAALPPRPAGRVVVIGAGKASARMAEAVEAAWGPCDGLIITRDGYDRPLQGIRVALASHPVSDQRGFDATQRMVSLLQTCGPDDFVLCLISGGGSSLLTWPAGDITLAQEQDMSRALLASGAPIGAMNTLRKHLSRIKGGNLAAMCEARMLTLIISDVPGDDPAGIASGPTVGDVTTQADALHIAQRWNIPLTPEQMAVLTGDPMTHRPDSPELARVENRIIAAPMLSLQAAADLAREQRIAVRILADDLEGEARDLARDHAALALAEQSSLAAGERLLLLSGGECTVRRRGDGTGGPNAEYALALAHALKAAGGISAIACDMDGVDGAADVAGAFVDATTLGRARALGLLASNALATNDSHSFFAALGDQIITGPTLTNVNDFRAILISGHAR